ncbi:MAG: Holliday junction resolvase RuvX [Candidatus Saccharimonadales bacterium]
MTTPASGNIVALDVGDKRVGVAIASVAARLASPLATLNRGAEFMAGLEKLLAANAASAVVVGLPRNLSGQDTAQTRQTRKFIADLSAQINLPVYAQDEAVTSIAAETELRARGKPYVKADIDALAATYILEDYLQASLNKEINHA